MGLGQNCQRFEEMGSTARGRKEKRGARSKKQQN